MATSQGKIHMGEQNQMTMELLQEEDMPAQIKA